MGHPLYVSAFPETTFVSFKFSPRASSDEIQTMLQAILETVYF
jgi:hypothetical protein